MTVKVFRSNSEGPFVGGRFWKRSYREWYVLGWLGQSFVCISRGCKP